MSVPVGGLNPAHVTCNWGLAVLGGAVIVFLSLVLLATRTKAPAE
jgi:hypothetical protein